MIHGRSNSCNDPIIDRKIQIRIVGPSNGRVTILVVCHGECAVERGGLTQFVRDALQAG